jgi:hypothetical protein
VGPTGDERDGETLPSDADRERAVGRLRAAHADGRLDVDELAERTGRAYGARTTGALADALRGLPSEQPRVPAVRDGGYGGGAVAGAIALTVVPPGGRLIALIAAVALLRSETSPARRRQLQAWALASGVLLAIEVVVLVLYLARA